MFIASQGQSQETFFSLALPVQGPCVVAALQLGLRPPATAFVPLRDVTHVHSLVAVPNQTLLRSTLRLSQPLDGLHRTWALGACFISQTARRIVFPSKEFSLCVAATCSSHGLCPLAVLRPAPSPIHPLQLRGFSPHKDYVRLTWRLARQVPRPSSGSRSSRPNTTADAPNYSGAIHP